MGAGVWLLLAATSMSDLFTVIFAGVVGVAIYGAMLVVLRIDEAKSVMNRFVRH
jgi:hypothetical protein